MFNSYSSSLSLQFFMLLESVYSDTKDFDMLDFLLGDGQ